MSDVDDRVRAVVETYGQQQAQIVAVLMRILLNLWSPFKWWDRPEMVRAWAARSAVEVDLALTRARRLSRNYTSTMLEISGAGGSMPELLETYERGGTPLTTVYERPARLYRYVEKQAEVANDRIDDVMDLTADLTIVEEDTDDDLAYDWGDRDTPVKERDTETEKSPADEFLKRLEEIVEFDVAATARDEQQRLYAASSKVVGYRRVIHPELSKTGSCGLCVVAADRFYTVKELLPIHDRCKCTTAPITGTSDPALNLSREDLDALYERAGSTYGEDLKKIRITVDEHGEYGPVLIREGRKFRNVEKTNRVTGFEFTPFERQDKPKTKAMWAGMKDQSEKSLKQLRDARRDAKDTVTFGKRTIPVNDVDTAISYHEALIIRARAHGA